MALAGTTTTNQALNGIDASGSPTNLAAFISLHSASPSTTGANEFSGGGYARQAMTWNAASSGSKTNSGTASFTTAGSTAATHFATWSAVTAGTYGIGGALASSVTATTITVAAGALTITAS
jgi:hypothetical protein